MSELSGILSGNFIYDELETSVSGILSSDFSLTSGQILTENEIPDEDESFFSRLVWSYGPLQDLSNKCETEISNLNIEVYERKNDDEAYIIPFVRKLRYVLKEKLNVKITDSTYIKINNIFLTKNINEKEWNSYNVAISFRIINMR